MIFANKMKFWAIASYALMTIINQSSGSSLEHEKFNPKSQSPMIASHSEIKSDKIIINYRVKRDFPYNYYTSHQDENYYYSSHQQDGNYYHNRRQVEQVNASFLTWIVQEVRSFMSSITNRVSRSKKISNVFFRS